MALARGYAMARHRLALVEIGVLLMYTPEGVSSVASFIIAYEESR